MTAIWLWLLGKLGGVWIWVAVAGVALTAIVGFGAYEHNAGYAKAAKLCHDAALQRDLDIANGQLVIQKKAATDAIALARDLGMKEAQIVTRVNTITKEIHDPAAPAFIPPKPECDLPPASIEALNRARVAP